jgi:adenylylsulfate kinase-like enzyme
MTRTSGNGDGATAVHIALQGKGGVGKSLVSAILSQYLSSKGQDVSAIDADPVNQTLAEPHDYESYVRKLEAARFVLAGCEARLASGDVEIRDQGPRRE